METIDRIKHQINTNIESLNIQLKTEQNLHMIQWCKNRKETYEQALFIIDYEVKQSA